MIATEAPPKVTHNEIIKEATPTLAGAIAQTLADPNIDRFSEDDVQFLKFHGIYQQDDRDLRKTQKKFMMMIRGRIPGGVMTPNQWRVFDDLGCDTGRGIGVKIVDFTHRAAEIGSRSVHCRAKVTRCKRAFAGQSFRGASRSCN